MPKTSIFWKFIIIWNPKSRKLNLNLKKFYPIWKYISHMDSMEWCHVHVFKFIMWYGLIHLPLPGVHVWNKFSNRNYRSMYWKVFQTSIIQISKKSRWSCFWSNSYNPPRSLSVVYFHMSQSCPSMAQSTCSNFELLIVVIQWLQKCWIEAIFWLTVWLLLLYSRTGMMNHVIYLKLRRK